MLGEARELTMRSTWACPAAVAWAERGTGVDALEAPPVEERRGRCAAGLLLACAGALRFDRGAEGGAAVTSAAGGVAVASVHRFSYSSSLAFFAGRLTLSFKSATL